MTHIHTRTHAHWYIIKLYNSQNWSLLIIKIAHTSTFKTTCTHTHTQTMYPYDYYLIKCFCDVVIGRSTLILIFCQDENHYLIMVIIMTEHPHGIHKIFIFFFSLLFLHTFGKRLPSKKIYNERNVFLPAHYYAMIFFFFLSSIKGVYTTHGNGKGMANDLNYYYYYSYFRATHQNVTDTLLLVTIVITINKYKYVSEDMKNSEFVYDIFGKWWQNNICAVILGAIPSLFFFSLRTYLWSTFFTFFFSWIHSFYTHATFMRFFTCHGFQIKWKMLSFS